MKYLSNIGRGATCLYRVARKAGWSKSESMALQITPFITGLTPIVYTATVLDFSNHSYNSTVALALSGVAGAITGSIGLFGTIVGCSVWRVNRSITKHERERKKHRGHTLNDKTKLENML